MQFARCQITCCRFGVSSNHQLNAAVPRDCWSGTMLGIYYDQLPHWVVDRGCYSFMFRCRGSLPDAVLRRLSEIHEAQQGCVVNDEELLNQQRRSFKILEAYYDQSQGFAPFRESSLRGMMHHYLQQYDESGLRFDHWVIMPNHVHVLSAPFACDDIDYFKHGVRQFKLRSTYTLNQALQRSGSFWQKYQYDRWVRDEVEYGRWLEYFRQNPVKAGLCDQPEDWLSLQ